MGEAFYKVLYDFRHKANQNDFSTNYNTVQQKSFIKSNFTNFVIKQPGNSRKLRLVNSTILDTEIWLLLISYTVFKTTLQKIWKITGKLKIITRAHEIYPFFD